MTRLLRTLWASAVFGILLVAVVAPALADCTSPPIPPMVSISAIGPEEDGTVSFNVTYSFPGEPTAKLLQFLDNGVVVANVQIDPSGSGTTPLGPTSVACRTPGVHTFSARASSSCSGENTPFVTASVGIPVDNTPTVSVNAQHTGSYFANVDVTYKFPNTFAQASRELWLEVNGVRYDTSSLGFEGTWSTPVFTECWPSGTYTLTAYARACGEAPVPDSTSITVNSKPTVALSYSEADGGRAIVDYVFPNTFAAANRGLALYVDDVLFSAIHGNASGIWNPTIGTCWKKLRVVATACGSSGNPETVEQELDQSDKAKQVTVALLKAGAGLIQATVGWNNVIAGSTINLTLQNWTDAAGQQIAGGPLGGIMADTASGTDVINFAAPATARQLSVVASATTACGVVTGDASLDCDPCQATANPVYWSDGNMRLTDGELLPAVGGHRLVRTYDSEEQAGGLFGRGWTTLFERRLIAHSDGAVSILSETNEVVTFRTILGAFRQTWPDSGRAGGTLIHNSTAGTYTYRAPASTETAVFRDSDGRLLTLRNAASSQETSITYDAQGRPATFTDAVTGVTWNLTVDNDRRVTSIAVAGHSQLTWTYVYDASGNLMSVLAPGNMTWRTYEYSANRMTASYDALGHLIESHTYDANGYAITSTGDVDEIANIEYGLPGAVAGERVTRVTYKTGATAEYALRAVGGAWRPVSISGGCASCGTHDATYVRDTLGRTVREQGPDGYITVTDYASGRIQSEERPLKPAGCDPRTDPQHCRLTPDALAVAVLEATEATVRTTFEYGDASWRDRVTATFRPSLGAPEKQRRDTYTYHPTTGAVASTIVRGWTDEDEPPQDRVTSTLFYGEVPPCSEPECPPYDPYAPAFAPGGSFQSAWLALPQPAHRPKSVDGPRTDLQDVGSLVYYPIDGTVPALLRGRLAAAKNAAGHITRYESYDVFGNVTRTVDPNGVAMEMTFDNLGRLTASTTKGVPGCNTSLDPLCSTDLTSTRAYSAAGPLSVDQRPGGGVTVYGYDQRGRIRTISRGPAESDLREQIETSYDPLTGKNSLERTLAYESGAWQEKRRQSFGYDSDARLQTMTHADGAAIHYTYDSADRVSTIRDENHTEPNTTYAYDSAGRLESVTQTLAGASGGVIITAYGYDIHGNLTSVTDPNGNVTSYVYDDFGQLLSQVSPVTGTTTYKYDSAGNLIETTDANGAVTTRTYDALSRVTSATSTLASATEVVSWSYDDTTADRFALGRPASMTDPSGSTQYHYERRGLMRTETRTLMGAQYSYTSGFQYDADGNRAVIQYPSTQLTVTYGFDYAGRPTGASGVVVSAGYLPFGPLANLEFANNTSQQMSFDARYQQQGNLLYDLSELEPQLIAGYTYGHDAAGNVTSVEDLWEPEYNRTFQYDDLNRLTVANTGTGLWRDGRYTWDRMGNMLSLKLGEIEKGPTDPLDLSRHRPNRVRVQENRPLGRSSNFAYDGTTSRLRGLWDPVENEVTKSVTYDAAGNETAFVATRTYSPRNLLAEVTDSVEPGEPRVHKIAYTYDGRGVRVARAESPADGPNTTARRFFIYTPELQLMAATRDDASNVWAFSAADKNIRYEIVWFAGRPVAQITPAGPTLYTFTDHLGTPILQTDVSANQVWRAEYEPFGHVYEMRSGNRTDQPLRLPGQEVAMTWEGQEENYNIFRWYRSGWGRYTQPDPLSTRAFVNLYAYVDGRPTTLVDPLGLMSVDPATCGKYECNCANKVKQAAKDFDDFWKPGWASKNPKCFKALSNLAIKFKSPSGQTPITCMANKASKMTVKCGAGGTNCGGPPNLASYDPQVVWVQPMFCGDICGKPLNTIFHEALHNCGAPDESDQQGGLAKQIADVCVGK